MDWNVNCAIEYAKTIIEAGREYFNNVIKYDDSDNTFLVSTGVEDRELLCLLPCYYTNLNVGDSFKVKFGDKDGKPWDAKIKGGPDTDYNPNSKVYRYGYAIDLIAPNPVERVIIDINVIPNNDGE